MAKCLECFHWKACFNGKEWDAAVEDSCEYFLATANFIPHGRWKYFNLPVYRNCPITDTIRCTLCGKGFARLQGVIFNFCPNCGADMRERTDINENF